MLLRFSLFLCLFLILLVTACSGPQKRIPYPTGYQVPQKSISSVRALKRHSQCFVTKPNPPDDLAQPLPLDNPKLLVDKLTNKLQEWEDYGDKVDKAFKKCG